MWCYHYGSLSEAWYKIYHPNWNTIHINSAYQLIISPSLGLIPFWSNATLMLSFFHCSKCICKSALLRKQATFIWGGQWVQDTVTSFILNFKPGCLCAGILKTPAAVFLVLLGKETLSIQQQSKFLLVWFATHQYSHCWNLYIIWWSEGLLPLPFNSLALNGLSFIIFLVSYPFQGWAHQTSASWVFFSWFTIGSLARILLPQHIC